MFLAGGMEAGTMRSPPAAAAAHPSPIVPQTPTSPPLAIGPGPSFCVRTWSIDAAVVVVDHQSVKTF